MPDKDKFKEYFTSDLAHADVFNEKCFVPGEENRKKLDQHIADETNPHEVTWDQTGASPSPHNNDHHDPAYAECPHGNECHDPNFLPADTDLGAPCPHGNECHDPPFATLDDIPEIPEFPEIPPHVDFIVHGNEWHSPDFRAIQPTGIQFRVGATRDYTTLNAALAAASRLYPLYVREGLSITVLMDADYVERQGVDARGIDLSYIRIASVGNATITANVPSHLFQAYNGAKLPLITCKFNMGGKGHDGFHIRRTSSVVITSEGGILNAGDNGLAVYSGSTARANGSTITGAKVANISVGFATVTAQDATLTGGKQRGVFCNTSRLSVVDANCRMGVGNSSSDIYLTNGSIVQANGATGGCNVSFNALTSAGICFQ